MPDRQSIARRAADRLAGADLRRHRAVVGFDGFIDAIIDVVDTRRSMAPHDYTRLATIEQYAARCAAAAGKSMNAELVVKEERFGGNGPLLAGGLAQLGLPTTYIGAVGQTGRPSVLHPLYDELHRRCAASGGEVIPVAPPAYTHALEFDDGKIMLGDPRNVQSVTWRALSQQLGERELAARLSGASLLGIVNWVMMAGVQGILHQLATNVLPASGRATEPRVFIDLCDPAKRTDTDVESVLAVLRELNTRAPVTLGLNLSESQRIDRVSSARAYVSGGLEPTGAQVRDAAQHLRAKLNLDCVVIHPRQGAGAASASGHSSWMDGPLVRKPLLSTGAGDHFNAGFALAQLIGAPIDEALAIGVGVSGTYVRDAQSPTRDRLVQFLRDLPMPE